MMTCLQGWVAHPWLDVDFLWQPAKEGTKCYMFESKSLCSTGSTRAQQGTAMKTFILITILLATTLLLVTGCIPDLPGPIGIPGI